jgi:hypothetical protein
MGARAELGDGGFDFDDKNSSVSESSGNSVAVEKLRHRNSRLVPRATKNAVSDWRPWI